MCIDNGIEKTNNQGKIILSNSLVIPFTMKKESLHLLFKITYPNLHECHLDTSFITSCAILTTNYDYVDEINDMLIA